MREAATEFGASTLTMAENVTDMICRIILCVPGFCCEANIWTSSCDSKQGVSANITHAQCVVRQMVLIDVVSRNVTEQS